MVEVRRWWPTEGLLTIDKAFHQIRLVSRLGQTIDSAKGLQLRLVDPGVLCDRLEGLNLIFGRRAGTIHFSVPLNNRYGIDDSN